jgi:hypothetical protein
MRVDHDHSDFQRGFAAGYAEGRRARRSTANYLALGFVILVIISILTETVFRPSMGENLNPNQTIELPPVR